MLTLTPLAIALTHSCTLTLLCPCTLSPTLTPPCTIHTFVPSHPLHHHPLAPLFPCSLAPLTSLVFLYPSVLAPLILLTSLCPCTLTPLYPCTVAPLASLYPCIHAPLVYTLFAPAPLSPLPCCILTPLAPLTPLHLLTPLVPLHPLCSYIPQIPQYHIWGGLGGARADARGGARYVTAGARGERSDTKAGIMAAMAYESFQLLWPQGVWGCKVVWGVWATWWKFHYFIFLVKVCGINDCVTKVSWFQEDHKSSILLLHEGSFNTYFYFDMHINGYQKVLSTEGSEW